MTKVLTMRLLESPTRVASLFKHTLSLPPRRLKAGTVLYRLGNEATLVYLVEQGVLKGVVTTSLGRERLAEFYGAGDALGVAALERALHTETVTAIQDAVLFPVQPVQALADANVSRYLISSLAKQVRRCRDALQDTELPVGARLCRALLRLARRFGQPADDPPGITLPLALTHEDLASLIGSSRVTVTRILGELREQGVLVGTRGVYLIQPPRLEAALDHYVLDVL